MKKMILLLVVFALALISPVAAADHYNAGSIAKYESHTSLTYVWKVTVPALGDSAGSWHSRPMLIADCNDVDGYTSAFGTAGAGTEDVNILYHMSYDNRTNWFGVVTPAGYDSVGATVIHDTIGTELGANTIAFHNGGWLVVEYDGQASNPSNRLFTFIVTMTKDLEIADNAGGYVRIAKYATKSNTNP